MNCPHGHTSPGEWCDRDCSQEQILACEYNGGRDVQIPPPVQAERADSDVLILGFWDAGEHYQVKANGSYVELHHLRADGGGLVLPLDVFWGMVRGLEAQGRRSAPMTS